MKQKAMKQGRSSTTYRYTNGQLIPISVTYRIHDGFGVSLAHISSYP